VRYRRKRLLSPYSPNSCNEGGSVRAVTGRPRRQTARPPRVRLHVVRLIRLLPTSPIDMSREETAKPKVTDVLETALAWVEAGREVAMATVIETGGSSPRPAGSNLVVAADGAFEGSVSGGCVEGAVVSAALDVIASGEPKILDFGYTDADAWEVGLACGGSIKVLVERIE